MHTYRQLIDKLNQINGRGYKAYKDIVGQYEFDNFILSIDYVQGDPFASPSRIRAIIPNSKAGFPDKLYDLQHKRTAVIDFLSRLVHKNIRKYYERVKGSGKSGILSIDVCGQEILDRTSIFINKDRVEVRMEVGLPAAGRRILSKEAVDIFINTLPKIVENSLFYNNINKKALNDHVSLAEDQYYIRQEMKKRGVCAFIADGAILPRESGISQRPLKNNVIPFKTPESMSVTFNTPNRGEISGLGIMQGITLIVGGGYHGKSTLLRALELGVYNHIEGDGREFVLTNEAAVKIRAEDGRRVEKVNISTFINNLPNGSDTTRFCTDNASGSTSQAANIMEAIEMESNLLLIDEDTSATNFMIRDKKMQALVNKDKEPITPFIDRVRELYEKEGISSILVVGSSGDYFGKADSVIMMEEYIPHDVTNKAKQIFTEQNANSYVETEDKTSINVSNERVILKSSFPKDRKGIKVKSKGLHNIMYNKSAIILDDVEQLISNSQTNCIAQIIRYINEKKVDNKKSLKQIIDEVYNDIDKRGLEVVSNLKGHPGNLAKPRKHEIAAAFNRFRQLTIK